MLALGGALLAFVPADPSWTLEPDLALALFVAPVLLDAAFDTSLRDLRNNWLPVTALVIVAVGLTTAAVAVLAHCARAGHAVGGRDRARRHRRTARRRGRHRVLRQVNLPHRIRILEGESLLNDASALLIYRVAVGAAAASISGGARCAVVPAGAGRAA